VVAELSLIDVIRKCEGDNSQTQYSVAQNGRKTENMGNSSTIALSEICSPEQRYSANGVLRQRFTSSRMLGDKKAELNSSHEVSGIESTSAKKSSSRPSSLISPDSHSIGINPDSPDLEATHSEKLLSWRRILLLIMAVTVHNIPEGLAVGVGFGSVGKTPAATFEKVYLFCPSNHMILFLGLQFGSWNWPSGYLFHLKFYL
jgi:hypothetical protein